MKSFFYDRCPILDVYLFRRVLLPSLGVTLIVLSALAMERLLRLVEQVTNDGVPAGSALELVSYLLPHYLGLAIPAGFFFGTLYGLSQLQEHSELVVMRSVGISARHMLRSILALAMMLTVCIGLLNAFIQPYARHAFRERLNHLTASAALTGLRAGVFVSGGENLTMRANEVSKDGRHFNQFFMAWNRAAGRRVIVTAASAELLDSEPGGPATGVGLLLHHGRALEQRSDAEGNPRVQPVEFGEMRLVDRGMATNEVSVPRGRDERELTVPELWAGGIPGRMTDASPASLRAELHARMLNTLAVPVFGVLAIPLALAGRGRGARTRGYAVAVVMFVLFQKVAGLGQALAASGAVSPWMAIWIPFAGLVGTTGAFFHHYSGDRGRSLFDAMAEAWPQSLSRRVRADNGDRAA